MHHDPEYDKKIEEATPIPDAEIKAIQKDMGFSYKQLEN